MKIAVGVIFFLVISFLILLIIYPGVVTNGFCGVGRVDFENPGNCVRAESQCNSCSRIGLDFSFHCTEMVCDIEKEKFYCKECLIDN